ncbi:hypothetical protein TI39_contig389g00001 [Zymoseptoria brevis]|uniref:Uncharacterized protein n=1 Tax=Zymoseptoria brevis TaxID=1047168 RepID=A0A0F4GNJ3_9PEZI|nr:hypothetical protein TI39_contig389g00001 [Zymoseptoria brevis]
MLQGIRVNLWRSSIEAHSYIYSFPSFPPFLSILSLSQPRSVEEHFHFHTNDKTSRYSQQSLPTTKKKKSKPTMHFLSLSLAITLASTVLAAAPPTVGTCFFDRRHDVDKSYCHFGHGYPNVECLDVYKCLAPNYPCRIDTDFPGREKAKCQG